MKTHRLLSMLLVGCSGGWAWAQDQQCSVAVGDVHITITDPNAGTASADATCAVVANFPATITPTVKAEAGFKNPADNHWVWTATIDGKAFKNIVPNEESVSPINVTVSGVTLSDPAFASPTKVATITVTITEDESKSLMRPRPVRQRGRAAINGDGARPFAAPTAAKQPGQALASTTGQPVPVAGLSKP